MWDSEVVADLMKLLGLIAVGSALGAGVAIGAWLWYLRSLTM